MKRLLLFVGIFVLASTLFSGILHTEKTYAARLTCPAGQVPDVYMEQCVQKCPIGQMRGFDLISCIPDNRTKEQIAAQKAQVEAAVKKIDAEAAAKKIAAGKASAGVTDADYNKIVSDVTTGFASVDLSGIDGADATRQEILDSFKRGSLGTYNTLKSDPSYTAPMLREKIFGALITDLQNRTRFGTGPTARAKRNTAQRLLTPITVLYNNSTLEINVEKGTITATEAAKETVLNADTGAARTTQVVKNQTTVQNASKCNIWKFSLIDCVDTLLSWIIQHTLLMYAGWVLWLTATIMNYSIQIGILDFSKWAPDALYPIWIIIRQVVSLFLVFAGLYLGFMYVLGREETFARYMPFIILYALFVNFSYPLVRIATDISNVVSLNVYTSAVGAGTLDKDVDSEKTAGAIIRNKLGLMGVVDFATQAKGSTKAGEGVLNSLDSTPAALLAVIFIGYAAYIFFMVSGILILRTAALIFLIVASPILLIDSVIPKLGDVAMKMRKILFEQLAVAPVFTIMLALTLKFMEVFQTGPLAAGGLSSGGGNSIVMFFNLFMMLIMLHIMLKVTKSVAGSVGEMATKAMGTVGGFATGAAMGVATGGTGFLARATLGRAAAAVGKSDWVEKNQDSFRGRFVKNISGAVANSSLDLSNSKLVAGGANRLGMNTMGMGMGSRALGGGAGGYKQQIDARQKLVEDRGAEINIYHKEDKYEKDASGKQVLVARAGDVDKSKLEARNRYYATSGGYGRVDKETGDVKASLFMTKAEQRRTKELIQGNLKKEGKGVDKEVKTLSDEDVKSYDNVKDIVDEKGNVVVSKKAQQAKMRADSENELSAERKRDPGGLNKQTMQLQETVNQLRQKHLGERAEEFNSASGTSVEKEQKQHDVMQILERNYHELTSGSPAEIFANNGSAEQIKQTMGELRKKIDGDKEKFSADAEKLYSRWSNASTDKEKDSIVSRIADPDLRGEVGGMIESGQARGRKIDAYRKLNGEERKNVFNNANDADREDYLEEDMFSADSQDTYRDQKTSKDKQDYYEIFNTDRDNLRNVDEDEARKENLTRSAQPTPPRQAQAPNQATVVNNSSTTNNTVINNTSNSTNNNSSRAPAPAGYEFSSGGIAVPINMRGSSRSSPLADTPSTSSQPSRATTSTVDFGVGNTDPTKVDFDVTGGARPKEAANDHQIDKEDLAEMF